MHDRRVRALGDFDVVGGIFSLGAAAIGAGGQVGSAAITADAQRSIAQDNLAAQLQLAIGQEETQLQLARLNNAQQTQTNQQVADAITSPNLLLAGLALVALTLLGRH